MLKFTELCGRTSIVPVRPVVVLVADKEPETIEAPLPIETLAILTDADHAA
jgi:hypothetical protein